MLEGSAAIEPRDLAVWRQVDIRGRIVDAGTGRKSTSDREAPPVVGRILASSSLTRTVGLDTTGQDQLICLRAAEWKDPVPPTVELALTNGMRALFVRPGEEGVLKAAGVWPSPLSMNE